MRLPTFTLLAECLPETLQHCTSYKSTVLSAPRGSSLPAKRMMCVCAAQQPILRYRKPQKAIECAMSDCGMTQSHDARVCTSREGGERYGLLVLLYSTSRWHHTLDDADPREQILEFRLLALLFYQLIKAAEGKPPLLHRSCTGTRVRKLCHTCRSLSYRARKHFISKPCSLSTTIRQTHLVNIDQTHTHTHSVVCNQMEQTIPLLTTVCVRARLCPKSFVIHYL